jgi:hypothetical protein
MVNEMEKIREIYKKYQVHLFIASKREIGIQHQRIAIIVPF